MAAGQWYNLRQFVGYLGNVSQGIGARLRLLRFTIGGDFWSEWIMAFTDIDIFDPAHYEKVRLPPLEAETLPPWCYSSEEFYRREMERIFMRSWLIVGREEQVEYPGDYRSVEIAGVPIIIVRGKDKVVRAFANSCRHRGAKIVEGEGNCKTFSCPYHSWVYDLDGRLRGAKGMEKTQHFEFGDYGLLPVRLEIWGGFIFVNFSKDAVGFREWIGDLHGRVESYNFENLRCTRRVECEIACNWKAYIENAMEEYHLPTVHRATINQLEMRHRVEPTKGQYCVIVEEHESTRAILPGQSGFPFIPTLEGAAAKGTHYVQVYPNLNFMATKDCLLYIEIYPLAVGRTKLVVNSLFPKQTIARDDFDEVVERYYHRLDESVPEDLEIGGIQQKGLSSPLARPGRMSSEEPLIHHIANWVLEQVFDAPLPLRKVVG